jgi:hypothetical protein
MNDANHTNTFELGPYSRAEIAEEALRRIVEDDVPGEGDWSICVTEFARETLERISGVR